MAIFGKNSEEKKEQGKVGSQVVATDPSAFVLVGPRISEKASRLAKNNKYVFVVKNSANKISVKNAIAKHYKVKVLAVNIVRNQGKTKNFGRTTGKTSNFKKAIVTLATGQSIETGASV